MPIQLLSMRNSPILSVIVFLLCGWGSGCIAAPNNTTQLLAKQSNTEKARPTSPSSIKKPSPSPFLPGVSLPIFPGTTPAATSSPTPVQNTPTFPLVEVPTPGLRAAKVKNSSNPLSSTMKRRKVVVDETPRPVRKRLKRREN